MRVLPLLAGAALALGLNTACDLAQIDGRLVEQGPAHPGHGTGHPGAAWDLAAFDDDPPPPIDDMAAEDDDDVDPRPGVIPGMPLESSPRDEVLARPR